jgi:hypothetical protein
LYMEDKLMRTRSDSFRLYEIQFFDAMIHFISGVHRT